MSVKEIQFKNCEISLHVHTAPSYDGAEIRFVKAIVGDWNVTIYDRLDDTADPYQQVLDLISNPGKGDQLSLTINLCF